MAITDNEKTRQRKIYGMNSSNRTFLIMKISIYCFFYSMQSTPQKGRSLRCPKRTGWGLDCERPPAV
jgi:hypothetical protein